ncbi:MAG: hypothetical protein CBC13_00980 [Planctomycetia bacterium TMED53]|nr:MAG: hypothetical protein CBC13_00980 [Planctomycetia bacterium TMED53]
MSRRSILIPTSLALLSFMIAAASTIPLDEYYEKDRLALPVTVSSGVPADVLLLQQSLGAFRGWAINALWLKALERRDQGQLHESMELARWILKLQPYFPRVWNFQSWLLAFELAFDTRNPQERWDWVREAIDLLRGPGLRANPLSREIHGQLAYLFWFKLGENRDSAAPYFRRQLFERWQSLLGSSKADPRSSTEILNELSQLSQQDEEISDLPSLAEMGLEERLNLLLSAEVTPEVNSRDLDLLRYMILVEELNMDPRLMVDLMRKLPGLDWRVPGSHAIYWAVQSVLREETGEIFPVLTDLLFAEALISSHVRIGLQQLIVRGRPVIDPLTGELLTAGPVPELLPVFLRSLESLGGGVIPDEFLPRAKEIIGDTALQAWLLGEDELTALILERLRALEGNLLSPDEAIEQQLAKIVRNKLDPEEPVTMISILIRARALIAAAGGGVESEFVRGEQFADLLEEDLSLAQQRRSKLLAWIEALRSPRASAPLPIKSRIWHNLPEGLREQIGEATRSVLRDDARLEGLVPEESFPGI